MRIEGGSKLNGVKRKSISPKEKLMIGTKCVNCGSTEDIRYHHIVPIGMGGSESLSNICCLCAKCHSLVHWGPQGEIDTEYARKLGRERARKNGVKLGRKPLDREPIYAIIAKYSTLFAGGTLSEEEVADMLGIKNTVYCKYKRELLEELEKTEWNHSFPKPERVRETPMYKNRVYSERLKSKRGEL